MKTLTVISSPIGNLGDLSPAMVEALSACELLLCESISAAQRLCQHAGIPVPRLKRCWLKNEHEVVKYLQVEKAVNIGLICDAGTPVISDPGYLVVQLFHQMSWQIRTVPGPSAVIAALVLSGIPANPFSFYGFLPPKKLARVKALQGIGAAESTWVLYESPRRIVALCEDILAVFGPDHTVCVIKEMTKVHETIWRGRIADVCQRLSTANLNGEFVVVGSAGVADVKWMDAAKLIHQELSVSTSAKLVSTMFDVSKSKVYDFLMKSKK